MSDLDLYEKYELLRSKGMPAIADLSFEWDRTWWVVDEDSAVMVSEEHAEDRITMRAISWWFETQDECNMAFFAIDEIECYKGADGLGHANSILDAIVRAIV